jgi:hypothetical protein
MGARSLPLPVLYQCRLVRFRQFALRLLRSRFLLASRTEARFTFARSLFLSFFSVILSPTWPYSVLGMANPTIEHQPHIQTSCLMLDFF